MPKERDGPPEPETDLLPGGRYRILRELGRGGTSVVWLAEDRHLQKEWAVKEIRKETGKDPEHVSSGEICQEVDILRKLEHPALPGIADLIDTDEAVYLVMDYIRGETLSHLRQRIGPVPEKAAMDWMTQLAQVLSYLHGQEPPVIHRDLKPSNVIRRPDGSLALIDLGIAREYKTEQTQDTRALGTKGYAPPEQYGGDQTDARSDIYALGVTITEMLTGIPPDQDPYLYRVHPFSILCPGISDRSAAILNRCLAASPEERYPDCRELLRDLRRPGKKAGKTGTVKKRLLLLAGILIMEIFGAVLSGSGRRTAESQSGGVPVREEQVLLHDLTGQLAEAGAENGFSEEESRAFLASWNELDRAALRDEEAYITLCFAAGQTYLYSYTGENGSFRERVLRAQPFFQEAKTAAETRAAGESTAAPEGSACPDAEQIGVYEDLCRFFADYVFSGVGVPEPPEREYRTVLSAADRCVRNEPALTTDDGLYLRLTLYSGIAGMLQEFRQGFAREGAAESEVTGLLAMIRNRTEKMEPSRETLTALRETVLEECRQAEEKIRQTYGNIQLWEGG